MLCSEDRRILLHSCKFFHLDRTVQQGLFESFLRECTQPLLFSSAQYCDILKGPLASGQVALAQVTPPPLTSVMETALLAENKTKTSPVVGAEGSVRPPPN